VLVDFARLALVQMAERYYLLEVVRVVGARNSL